MNKRKVFDLKFGERTEKVFFKYVNENLFKDDNLIKGNDYSVYDFSNKNCFVELKSRTNNYKKYETTMVGYNKLKIAEKDETDNNYIFFFLFTDGLYKWDFNIREYQVKNGGRYDRGRPEFKPHSFIPIEYLKLVTKDINSNTKYIEETGEENPNLIYDESESESDNSSNLE